MSLTTRQFDAFGALSHLDKDSQGIKVACAADWAAARYVSVGVYASVCCAGSGVDSSPSTRALGSGTPYDWTFTTRYVGDVDAAHSVGRIACV